MSATVIYLIGFCLFTLGVAYGAHLMGLSERWITTIVLILLGLGIFTAATRTRHREPPAEH
ncbi:MAG: hypothetical protein HY645_02905 [Acidobacteria bacterium]|nr:hypothetical protein [Acidobacteriota bacterium]